MDFKDELIYASSPLNTVTTPADIEQAISRALRSKTIGVVDLSKNPSKLSRDVAAYMKS